MVNRERFQKVSKRNIIDTTQHNFELKLASGKTKTFGSGSEMYTWAVQNNPKMEFKFDERTGPFLCDYFERLRKN